MDKCNICNYEGEYDYFDSGFGTEAEGKWKGICPKCKSLPRHREAYEFIKTLPDDKTKKCLGISTEACNAKILENKFDFTNTRVEDGYDLTKMPLENDSVDIIYACHVLEHIKEESTAMQEMARVLKTGGFAILLFPTTSKLETDYSGQVWEYRGDPERKSIHFRKYGYDSIRRFLENGFSRVDVIHINKYWKQVWIIYK